MTDTIRIDDDLSIPAEPVVLSTPRIKVTRPDLTRYVVQVTNSDLVGYDVTAYRHKWPPSDRAPMLWATFLAWHGSRRTGAIELDLTFEVFRDTFPSIEVDADRPADDVNPTQSDHASDY